MGVHKGVISLISYSCTERGKKTRVKIIISHVKIINSSVKRGYQKFYGGGGTKGLSV